MDTECLSSILHFENITTLVSYLQTIHHQNGNNNMNINDIINSTEQQIKIMNKILYLLQQPTLKHNEVVELYQRILGISTNAVDGDEECPLLFYELLSHEDSVKKLLQYLNVEQSNTYSNELNQLCLCVLTKIYDHCVNKEKYINMLVIDLNFTPKIQAIINSVLESLAVTSDLEDFFTIVHGESLSIICVALNFVKRLYSTEPKFERICMILYDSLHESVYNCLKYCINDEELCEYCMNIMYLFTKDFTFVSMELQKVNVLEYINTLKIILEMFSENEQISHFGCLSISLLSSLLNGNLTNSDLSTTSDFQDVESILKKSEEILQFVFKQLQEERLLPNILCHYLSLLNDLSSIELFHEHFLHYNPVQLLLNIGSENVSHAEVSHVVMRCLVGFKEFTGTNDSQWLTVLFNTMKDNLHDAKVQEAACHALSTKVAQNPSICNMIGEQVCDKDPVLFAVHSLVFAALNIHSHNVYVFQAACGAIYELSIHSKVLQCYLVARGAYVSIIKEMKAKPSDIEVHCWGCRALRALAFRNPHQEELLFMYGILPLLKADLHSFVDESVLKECIGLLACLANDLEIFRRDCVRHNIPDLILRTAMKNAQNDDLIEMSFEAIAVFATSEEQPFLRLECLQDIRHLMTSNVHSERIQRNGCILMQLFGAHEDFIADLKVAGEIIEIISEAMRRKKELQKTLMSNIRFDDNVSTQTEGCIALYLLMEHEKNISQNIKINIVERNVEDLLFGIIDYFNKTDEITLLAQKCLIELTCSQQLKDTVLQRACFLESLQCVEYLLQLGADVDFGEPSCLCLAASAGNLKILQLLLSYDASDAAQALSICLDECKWSAAGVLLRHIGYERNHGSITWSALNIKEINSELLFPTLLCKREIRLDNDGNNSPLRPHRMPFRIKSSSFNEDTLKEGCREKVITRVRSSSEISHDMSSSAGRQEKTLSGAILPYNKSDPRLEKSCLERRNSYDKHVVLTSPRHAMHYPNYPNSILISEMSDERFGKLLHPDRAITPNMVEKSRGEIRKSLSDINLLSLDRIRSKTVAGDDEPPVKIKKRQSSPPKRKSCLQAFEEERRDSVKTFDVSRNNLNNFDELAYCPSELVTKFFQGLELIDLSHNMLHEFPTGMIFQQLRTLNISHNKIHRFPYEVLQQQNIETLDLSNNNITEIRFSHFDTSNTSLSLVKLNMSANRLRHFPSWMSETFPRLNKLLLSRNHIKEIPLDASGMRSLRELNMSHNKLNKLSERFINECTSLEKVDFSHNHLMMLPNYTPSTLSRLSSIKLSHNELKERRPFFIPKLLLSVPSLQYLDVSYNRISQLPEPQYWSSKCIRELNFSHNRIVKINLTKNVANCWPEITRLNLSDNKLGELGSEIGHLSTLMSLDVSNNSITKLPDEIGRLVNLYDFPLTGMLLERYASLGTPRDMVSFFSSKLKNSEHYHRLKLLLVGRANRGKTTLVRQLAQKKHPMVNLATNGISINDWTLQPPKSMKDRSIKQPSFLLNTWDFAGQEDFYCTHQYFLSSRALYLAVYDASKGVEEIALLTPWLLNIQAAAPGSMVILVGTHADKLTKATKNEKINTLTNHIRLCLNGPGFPTIRSTAFVNCTKETSGIEYLRAEIYKIVSTFSYKGQAIVDHLVPKSYIELEKCIRKEVVAIRESNEMPVYHSKKLWQMCCEKGIHLNFEEFGRALKFLKETGSILNFNDPLHNLSSFYFIDPQWLCEMMARVVTIKQINPYITNQGVLSKVDAKNLFPDGKYSPEFLERYFRLLRKFEVVLPITCDKYLVTSKLRKEPPQIITAIQAQYLSVASSGVVTRRYVFPYIPNGFWARLITRILSSVLSKKENGFQRRNEEPCQLDYWQHGIFIKWSSRKFFLINLVPGAQHEFDLYVPVTRAGYKLLGKAVNFIDSLIEEWYPGLAEEGSCDSIERLCPCSSCFYSDAPHLFGLLDCIKVSYQSDIIECPNCGPRYISSIAPDAMFADIDSDLLYDLTNQLRQAIGVGAFASVYRAKVNGVNLAIKVFKEARGSNPNRLLRQEVDILNRLHHPCLISIIGVCLRPRMLLLEYAPLGDLAETLKSGRGLTRGMQHRIALQISEGLAYLHENKIAYRDLKPSNILVFSLSMAMLINVKIADYGISQETTTLGLNAPTGTPGFQAPEVTNRDSEYCVKVDVFSFGITLYQIVTGGQMPYGDIPFQNELEGYIMNKKPITNITSHGCSPWPDVEYLIEQCLVAEPEQRPSMQEIRTMLLNVDLLCLKREVNICKDQTVECIAVRDYKGVKEVWVGTGCSKSYGQLSWFSLKHEKKQTVQGMIVRDGRIFSMLAYEKFIIIGTGTLRIEGKSTNDKLTTIQPQIAVYDGDLKRKCFSLATSADAVLSLQYIQSRDVLIAGLLNGSIACYKMADLCENGVPFQVINMQSYLPNEMIGPVSCSITSGSSLLIGCGISIVQLSLDQFDVSRTFTASESNNISFLVQTRNRIYTATKDSSVITVWDIENTYEPHNIIDIHALLTTYYENKSLPVRGSRVVSMAIVDRSVLWVGCGDGHVVLVDLVKTKYKLLSTFWRHSSAVRAMVVASSTDGKSASVISGGLGFKRLYGVSNHNDEFGYVLTWEADLAKQQKHLENEKNKRDDLALQMMAETAFEEDD